MSHRKINLNIGIYNPNRESRLEGEYDLIISNPDSLIKKNSKLKI